MSPELRQKIAEKLRKFLNREPSEKEIVNSQNDANIMGIIAQDDAREAQKFSEIVATAAQVDVEEAREHAKILSKL